MDVTHLTASDVSIDFDVYDCMNDCLFEMSRSCIIMYNLY